MLLLPVADPAARWGGGPRNIKSMQPNSVAIFFMTYFYRAGEGGAWPPRPPWPLDTSELQIGWCIGNQMY